MEVLAHVLKEFDIYYVFILLRNNFYQNSRKSVALLVLMLEY